MIRDYIPVSMVETPPSEPFNWFIVLTVFGIIIVIALIVAEIIIQRKKFKKKHKEWRKTQEYMKSHNNGDGCRKYISMPFQQFHEYYSLNPERYYLQYASVLVRNLEVEEEDNQKGLWRKEYSHEIIFTFKEYKKYRAWVAKVTNGMEDSAAVTNTLSYLNKVQADIQKIRDKETKAVEESQEAMKNFMEGYKAELKLESSDQEENKE